ncbi:PTS galactosamine/N-acetylgalactosamine transporter subunit IIA [Vibrio hangzhouensis]|uniref:PTS system N-acetylgalactosamine-specific EIIA component, Man family n=1 Tax=Vibrio hangzhouensis TaxID=462991 RepID=A0A1H6B980_9VIBR|nr:PTS galactosamine/N-acetylgalactosamine transporter subunit IIA [Vibrio hangzhouensis]SEG56965.1 PTS system N-acetylgalactosamine-specific EIIA component, Man family [Vibrio hangzhouensis]
MIGLVISGHLNFATGMQSAMCAIAGQQSKVEFVDFVESMSTEELEVQLRAARDKVESGSGVLFLTDIPGGSPCNRAMNIMMDTPNVELLAGVNLPMIANAAFEREDTTLVELVETLQEIGVSCLQNMRKELEASMKAEPILCEEGGL